MSAKAQGALALLAILLAMGLLGSLDADEADRQADRYCDNVAIWQATNGDSGWPDYRRQFEGVCK